MASTTIMIDGGESSWSGSGYTGAAEISTQSNGNDGNTCATLLVTLRYANISPENWARAFEGLNITIGEIGVVTDNQPSPGVSIGFTEFASIEFTVKLPYSYLRKNIDNIPLDISGRLRSDVGTYLITESHLVDTSESMLKMYGIELREDDSVNALSTTVYLNGEFFCRNEGDGTNCFSPSDEIKLSVNCTLPYCISSIVSNVPSLDKSNLNLVSYETTFKVSSVMRIEDIGNTGIIGISVTPKLYIACVSSHNYNNHTLGLNMTLPTDRYGYKLSFICGDVVFPDTVTTRTENAASYTLESKHYAAIKENGNEITVRCCTVMDTSGTLSDPMDYNMTIEPEIATISTNKSSYYLDEDIMLSYGGATPIFNYSLSVTYGSISDNIAYGFINSSGLLVTDECYINSVELPNLLTLTTEYAAVIPNTHYSTAATMVIIMSIYAVKEDGTHVFIGVNSVNVDYSVPNNSQYRPEIIEKYYLDANSLSRYLATGESGSGTPINTKLTDGASACEAHISVQPKAYASIQSVTVNGKVVTLSESGGLYSGTIQLLMDTYPDELPIVVTDSRGLQTSGSIQLSKNSSTYRPITVVPNSVTIERVPEEKDLTTAIADYKKVQVSMTLDGTIINFGRKKNEWFVYCLYKKESDIDYNKQLLFSSNDLTASELDAVKQSGRITICCRLDGEFDINEEVTVGYYIYDTIERYVLNFDLSPTHTVTPCLSSVKSPDNEVKSVKPIFDFGEDSFNINVDLLIKNESIFSLIYPVGAIYTTAQDNVPECFNGTWRNIGSTPQGSVTVKYFQRTE